MSDKANLLKVKATLKKRQPRLIRQDAHKHKRVGTAYRAPKGLHSKMRNGKRGYRVKLQRGWQSPVATRGMTKQGLLPVRVATVAEVAKLDAKKHAVLLAGGLGGRKKIMILEEAAKHKLTILNAPADAIERIKATRQKVTDSKKQLQQSKDAKKKSLEEKAAKKEKEAKDEDKKDADAEHKHDHKHDHKEHKHEDKQKE